MNILHINSYYSTTKLYTELYERQRAAGLNISVYVPIAKEYPNKDLAVTGDYTLVSRNHKRLDRYVFQLKHQKILKDLLNQYNFFDFDMVHAHSLFSNGWLAYQLWKRYAIPYVVAVRSTDVRTFFQKVPWLRKTGLDILLHASRVIFISRNTQDEVFDNYIPHMMQERIRQKTLVIPNGIDQFWHQSAYQEKTLQPHQPLRIISVGSVTPRKRFLQLAQMVSDYANKIQPAELHIVGPAWQPKIVSQLKKMKHVYYYGPQSKETLLDMYRQMDVFALLSSPETFGLVYPEAMSQGLPLIYTKNEGFDSFFPDHTVGVSVEKQDHLGFNRALDYIQKHYSCLAQNALTGIQYFDWDHIHHSYCQLYESVITSHKAK